jgi:hypothetical protein
MPAAVSMVVHLWINGIEARFWTNGQSFSS